MLGGVCAMAQVERALRVACEMQQRLKWHIRQLHCAPTYAAEGGVQSAFVGVGFHCAGVDTGGAGLGWV
jgi:hypothetical protein